MIPINYTIAPGSDKNKLKLIKTNKNRSKQTKQIQTPLSIIHIKFVIAIKSIIINNRIFSILMIPIIALEKHHHYHDITLKRSLTSENPTFRHLARPRPALSTDVVNVTKNRTGSPMIESRSSEIPES